jgi:hypothetical protein
MMTALSKACTGSAHLFESLGKITAGTHFFAIADSTGQSRELAIRDGR